MDQKLIFRRAEPEDLPRLLDLYLGSIELMRFQGIDQWDDVYPSEDVLAQDIANRELYVLEDDDGLAASIVLNEDQEPQYRYVDWQYHTVWTRSLGMSLRSGCTGRWAMSFAAESCSVRGCFTALRSLWRWSCRKNSCFEQQ